MNDLDLLKNLGDDIGPANDQPPTHLRYRVLRAVANEPATGRRGARRNVHPAPARPRWGFRLAISGGLAAALVAGGFLATSLARDQDPATNQAQTNSTAPTTTQTPTTNPAPADAAGVLHNAALVAANSDLPAPRPDQFIFTEWLENYAPTRRQPDGSFTIDPEQTTLIQVWLSVDGTRDGLVRKRPAKQRSGWDEQFPTGKCAAGDSSCNRDPAYVSDLPTDPDALLAWLRHVVVDPRAPRPQWSPGAPVDPIDGLAFQRAQEMLTGGKYLTAPQRSALFEALAKLPGLTVRKTMPDLIGRHGLEIAFPGQESLIFDPQSYEFLGTPHSAVLRQQVVDRPGQLP